MEGGVRGNHRVGEGKVQVFERLYSDARLKSAKQRVPNERLSSPRKRKAAPRTFHSYINLASPLQPVLELQQTFSLVVPTSARMNTARQSLKVVVTNDIRVPPPNRLELRPVKPRVPDSAPRSVYQRLISSKSRPGPILTPHYSQLSPLIKNYGFSEGCRFAVSARKSATSP